MKKTFKNLLCLFMVFIFTSNLFVFSSMASEKIKVELNGSELTFDVPPQMIENRTMVPMRKIFESLGAAVDWDSKTQSITATKDSTKIIMQINKKDMMVNSKTITLDVPPKILSGRTLVPIRAIAEGFGASVIWDSKTKMVEIAAKVDVVSSKTDSNNDPKKADGNSTDSEKSASQNTDNKNANTDSDTTYILSDAPGLVKLLSSSKGDWQIVIPSSYTTVAAQGGNNIFTNSDATEIMNVHISSLKGVTESLDDIAKDSLSEITNLSGYGMTYTVQKKISKETINGLDYDAFVVKSSIKGRNYYSYSYLTIWGGEIFNFSCSTPNETAPQAFVDMVNSFKPVSVQTAAK